MDANRRNLVASRPIEQRTKQIVLDLLGEHARDGALPTTGRFVFYELEQRGDARKPSADDARPNKRRSIGWPPGAQDITDALTQLRDSGEIPWSWLVDTERSVAAFENAPTVAEYLRRRLAEATLNPWGGAPPLILTEDRGTAEVLERVASEYSCPIAGTKGQCNGFLRTAVAPLFWVGYDDSYDASERDVLYLGDLDRSGADIEGNSRRILEQAAPGWEGTWRRLALLSEQTKGITPIYKKDGRDGASHEAWELQALGQSTLVEMLRAELDALLPEPLAHILERERAERHEWAARLA